MVLLKLILTDFLDSDTQELRAPAVPATIVADAAFRIKSLLLGGFLSDISLKLINFQRSRKNGSPQQPVVELSVNYIMNLSNSLNFLVELNQNNNKEWMDANKAWYQECRQEFIGVVAELLKQMSAFDPGVAELEARKCIFRINRDIRFSNDKRPYKVNFGAAISEGGKHSENPSYYFHLQPGQNFVGGGIYMPQGEILKKIRQEVDYNPEELKKIVEQPDFQKVFGEIRGEKLKSAPKGYPKDHPNIEFLKLKSYTVMTQMSDKQVSNDVIIEEVIKVFKLMKPFNDYLAVAVS